MQNHIAIRDFVDQWRNSNKIQTAPTGNCKFPANVTYKSKKFTDQVEADVMIIRNGYDDGKIRLEEIGTLNADICHLDFSPNFQTYKYDGRDNSLNITGSSQKMSGSYSIKIIPR